MAKDYARSFYKSKAWRKCRDSYYRLRCGVCERCGSGTAVTVHHKRYITPDNINDPNVTLNHDNLELLCATCHQHEHYKKNNTQMGLVFNEYGDLMEIPKRGK